MPRFAIVLHSAVSNLSQNSATTITVTEKQSIDFSLQGLIEVC